VIHGTKKLRITVVLNLVLPINSNLDTAIPMRAVEGLYMYINDFGTASRRLIACYHLLNIIIVKNTCIPSSHHFIHHFCLPILPSSHQFDGRDDD
jgi:hypothetical protein